MWKGLKRNAHLVQMAFDVRKLCVFTPTEMCLLNAENLWVNTDGQIYKQGKKFWKTHDTTKQTCGKRNQNANEQVGRYIVLKTYKSYTCAGNLGACCGSE